MKKLLVLFLVLVMVVTMAACGKKEEPKKEEPKKEEPAKEEPKKEEPAKEEPKKEEPAKEEPKKEEPKKEEPAKEEPKKEEPGKTGEKKAIKIGFVTDVGGIDDKSFNQTTWEGIKKFADENGLTKDDIFFLQSAQESDYVPNLSQLADKKLDLIVAAGYKFEDAMKEVAANYPEQKFLLVDMVIDAPNVASAVFAEHEGSFLVGAAAALKAKDAGKTKVGYIGGEDFELIQRFEAGFEQGVRAIDPNMEVVVEYAGSFNDAAKGKTIASKLYDEGCYVIYHAAGGTGNGLFNEAKDRASNGQDVWACGVDTDQYAEGVYAEGKSVVLTSMLKGVGVASHDVAKLVSENAFKAEVMTFNLSNDGVNIPAENPNMKPEWIEEIKALKAKVKAGEITIDPVPSRLKGKQ